jgi:hypothetical protein
LAAYQIAQRRKTTKSRVPRVKAIEWMKAESIRVMVGESAHLKS